MQPSISQQAAWCRDALACQNACNLSGLAYSWTRQCEAMHAAGMSTDAICDHPASRLYAAKMADSCGLDYHWPLLAEVAANELIRRDEEEQRLASSAASRASVEN